MVAKDRTEYRQFYSRLKVITGLVLILFLGVLTKLFFLQVIGGKTARQIAEEQRTTFKTLEARRGEIKIADKYANTAYVLAGNTKKPLVYAVPGEIKDREAAAKKLAAILNIPEEQIWERFKMLERKYIPLKKQVSEEEERQIKELALAGVYFDFEEVRVYGEKTLLGRVLGFVGYKGENKQGLYGLERYYEKELAGVQGSAELENSLGGWWIFGGKRKVTEPIDGAHIFLNIDKSIQYKAESVLEATVKKHGADSGSIIVMDPKEGRVLAMASYPEFDPNAYNKVTDQSIFSNAATMDAYEPGSVIKPFTMAAALNEEKVSPNSTYTDTGKIEVDGYTIKNSEGKVYGNQTMAGVLEESINTGAVYALNQVGNKKFLEYLKSFGFGKQTGIDLPEAVGSLDNLKGNVQINFFTASFGQGFLATPIQVLAAFSGIANEGKLLKPMVVRDIIYPSGEIKTLRPEVVSQPISAKTASALTAMLVNVVENGHGKRAGVPGYYIAGKTGTAQVARKDGKGYEENNNIGTFVGFGPVENPVFSMIVRINHPRSVKFAESTAAPAFGEIAKFILDYYNIPPTRK